MNRRQRNFYDRDPSDQRWMTENTWCDVCGEADLGITEPNEYAEDGEVYLEGKCRKCGGRVVTRVTEE